MSACYLYDVSKSLGFGVRNDAKALGNGSDASVRGVVGTIQTGKAATSIFAEVNKYDKVARIAQNTANYVSQAVNPLLCVASVARVAASEDKLSTGIEEVGAMGAMFAGEGLMKKQFQSGSALTECKLVKNNVAKFEKFCANTKYLKNFKPKSITSVLQGLAFIVGSITSYSVGHSIGKTIADNTTRKYAFVNQPIAANA